MTFERKGFASKCTVLKDRLVMGLDTETAVCGASPETVPFADLSLRVDFLTGNCTVCGPFSACGLSVRKLYGLWAFVCGLPVRKLYGLWAFLYVWTF